MEHKIAALRRMIAFSRTVPNAWKEHDKLAKTTPGGMGIHAAVLDRDIGPLLQTQKLLDSVLFARMKGYTRPLTAAELELGIPRLSIGTSAVQATVLLAASGAAMPSGEPFPNSSWCRDQRRASL